MQDAENKVAIYLVLINSKTVLKATDSKDSAVSYKDVYKEYHPEENEPTIRRRFVIV